MTTTAIPSTLGRRIRAARHARSGGMTLERFGWELARLMGRPRPFDKMTVSYWETDQREPSWEALVSIARLTRLPLEYFAGVGRLEDYPVLCRAEDEDETFDLDLEILFAGAQRFDAVHQRIVLHQVEALVRALSGDGAGEGAAGTG